MTYDITTPTPEIEAALEHIGRLKAGILPPYLSQRELGELLAAWTRLYETPGVKLENQRFIVDHRLYEVPEFARLATHPIVQEAVRRTIGEFELAGFSVVATPNNGAQPNTAQDITFHIDHSVYSDVPVSESKDTFVCVWVNFEALAMENGPFVIAEGSHDFNMGYPEMQTKYGRRLGPAGELGWDHLARFNVGPAGQTAVYSGKTWHSGTINSSTEMRKGLNMNYVPKGAKDSTKRNPFDLCALAPERYARLKQTIGIEGYMIPWDAALATTAAGS